MMTEYVAPPNVIRAELQHFLRVDLADLLHVTSADHELANRLATLDSDLRGIASRCTDWLNASQTATIIDEYDRWCEEFETVESSEFDDQILEAWIALPH